MKAAVYHSFGVPEGPRSRRGTEPTIVRRPASGNPNQAALRGSTPPTWASGWRPGLTPGWILLPVHPGGRAGIAEEALGIGKTGFKPRGLSHSGFAGRGHKHYGSLQPNGSAAAKP